jgi:UDP-galactopyranose mutase
VTKIVEQVTPEALEEELAKYDAIIIGAGYAGSVVARELAERGGRTVAIVEQRPHIGGNAYDRYNEAGVLIHEYGPHIFHTNSARAWDYLSRFTVWRDYQHEVLADIHGTYTPVPFNLNSIELHFEEQDAERIKAALLGTYPANSKVPIIELRQASDPLLGELADFVYKNVFLYYTQKQWGQTPEEIDPAVTARVPVFVGRDNRYFTDTYQGMPLEGYTPMFESMLDHEGITVYTGVDARDVLEFSEGDGGFEAVLIGGEPYTGTIVYTGQLDYLVGERFGLLPYRTLDFVFKTLPEKHVLPCGTVNYTVSEPYTRITEFTWLTGQELDVTTIMEEYSRAFTGAPGEIPYYAIMNAENNAHYGRYLELFAGLENFHALGRLAEYRYFNMDQIVDRALALADELLA